MKMEDKRIEKEYWKPGNMLYPLPAVMVSLKGNPEPNILTIAWTGTCCTNPPMVYISVRPERYSYQLLKQTREFVINLTTKDLAFATDYCGVKSGKDTNKFKDLGLTPVASRYVEVPSILEAPVNMECRVKEILPLGSHHLFLAEVLGVTVDKRYLDEQGKFHLQAADLLAYSHGDYFALGEKIGKFGFSVKKTNKRK